jgi:predicted patatin/cPLA2 family phospholipase
VLLDRLAEGSLPGQRNDEHKVVLAVEGGGMRGAVSAGMLLALEQLGLRNSFDEVVGTSAGAIAGAFFVVEQGTKGSALYYTVLNSQRFVDRRRLFRSDPIMDIDYLVNDAFDDHGFDWGGLVNSSIPLFATVSPTEPDNPIRLFRVGETEAFARSVLVATASIPVVAGPSKIVDDVAYVDGGMIEAVPWRSAMQRGATHVLAVRSRRYVEDGRPEDYNLVERTTMPRLVKRTHGQHVADLVEDSPDRFFVNTESLRAIVDGSACPIDQGTDAAVVFDVVMPAPEASLPDRLEVDTHVLMDALAAGAQAMIDHLDIEGFAVEQRVVVTHPRALVGPVRKNALAPIVTARRNETRL